MIIIRPWLKLHKKILNWEWYSKPCVRDVFFHLLLIANDEPKKWHGIVINVGEAVIGRKELSKTLGFSEQQIRTALKKLTDTNEISQKSTNKYTVVKVLNYCVYQGLDNDELSTKNQQITINQPTNNQQITTPKDFKNLRNKDLFNNNINTPAHQNDFYNKIYTLYQENIGVPSPVAVAVLQDLISSHSADLMELAIAESVKANARNIRYIEAIFRNWDNQGITDINSAKLAIAEHNAAKTKHLNAVHTVPLNVYKAKNNKFTDYATDYGHTDIEKELLAKRLAKNSR